MPPYQRQMTFHDGYLAGLIVDLTEEPGEEEMVEAIQDIVIFKKKTLLEVFFSFN